MAKLVNRYPFSEPTVFSGVEKIANSTSFLVIGSVGNKGFFAAVQSDGSLQWARTIAVVDRPVGMTNLVPTGDGDFLVYGSYKIENNRLRHLVFRVRPNGQVVWQRELYSSNSRLPVQLVRNGDPSIGKNAYPFTLVGWFNKKRLIDTFEFRHLNANGDFLSQPQTIGDLHASADNQISAVCQFDFEPLVNRKMDEIVSGLAFGGGTTFFGDYQPYLVLGNQRFQHRSNYVIRSLDGKYDGHIDALLYDAESGRLIVGFNRWAQSVADKANNSIVLCSIEVQSQQPTLLHQVGPAVQFGLSDKEEKVRKIIRQGNFFYAIVNTVDGSLCSVVRFQLEDGGRISLLDVKRFTFGANAIINDISAASPNQFALTGYLLNKDQGADAGFFLLTEADMGTCVTQNLPAPPTVSLELEIAPIDARKLDEIKVPEVVWTEGFGEWSISEQNTRPEPLCPSREFELEAARLVQSPYLNLQAAGSVGEDSSFGIHLRWFLLNYLGDNHLPKANYATNTANFNRPNDFVFLYRWPYQPHEITIDFHSSPAYIDGNRKIWTYLVNGRLFYLYFHDSNKYNTVRASVNPATNAYGFLAQYHPGPLELRLRDELFFAGKINVIATQAFTLLLETHSVEENTAIAPRVVSSSATFNASSGPIRFKEENIRSLYFSLSAGNVNSIQVETYFDAITIPAREKAMQFVGQFALTKDTAEAYRRLEEPSRFQVHGTWRKFNDGAFVNVQNYQNRWYDAGKPNACLFHGVDQYIQLSDNAANPLAIATLTADPPDTDTPPVDSSYLDMLQIVASDFHIARMLGLGYVDTPAAFFGQASESNKARVVQNPQPKPYLYLIEYITEADLNDGRGAGRMQHLYLSLPTSVQDQRLPLPLQINALTYGLYAQQNTATPILLTDLNGYTPDGLSRFINIFANLPIDYSKYPGLLPAQKLFYSFATFSFPVFAGVEYRKLGEGAWRRPEIAHEDDYVDTANQLETTPLVLRDNKPCLIHREREEGIHEYAPYASNIFSRASQLGGAVATDLTHFVRRNTLLPPSEFHVQLIQRENPLLLTTTTEQSMLDLLNTASDKTLVRVTFNYHHIHDRAYDFGNRVRIFFRPESPRAVIGGVKSVQDVGLAEQDIEAENFTYYSTGEVKVPDIPLVLRPNFLGSALAVDGKLFFIHDIAYNGGNSSRPILRIRKNEVREAQTSGGQATLSQQLVGLNSANDLHKPFLLVENMSQAANWGIQNPLSFEIEIGDSSQWTTRNDGHRNEAGDWVSYSLRGIWAQANIQVVAGLNGADNFYHLKFPGFQLNHHAQYAAANPVEWHKGIVRIGILNHPDKEKKALKVLAIYHIGDGQDLELDVYDEAFNLSDFDRLNTVEVNFYPGYKAYFYSEQAKGFSEAAILPAAGEEYRNTLMGACSVDSGNSYQSSIGTPAILMAQEIIEPMVPGLPEGPLYATLPDWYNKATYTFSVQLLHTPYAVIFYRADLNAILYALYKPETFKQIKAALPAGADDEWFTSRWQDLLTFPTGVFADFPTGTGTYRFPKPDKTGLFDGTLEPNATPQMAEKVKKAIYASFLPLTKEPILYKNMQHSDTLTVGKPAKISSGNKVQFSDFTIDGSMATSYFYCAREMGNRMDLGAHSLIAGPVQLVNTSPPPAPVVRKMTVRTNDGYTGVTSAVMFQINDFPAFDRMTKIQIFRADTAVDALSVRTMQMVKEIDLNSLVAVDNLYSIEDNFQGLQEVPYGDPLFYRIVSIREVPCQDVWGHDIVKYVPSYPTKVFLANVVDSINPVPPEITISATPSVDKLTGVQLSWSKTTYKGTYYLFKMTSAGQWNKIHDIKNTSNSPTIVVNLLDTTWASDILPTVNDDGDTIYHRFKVNVESTSGLLNLYDKAVTAGI